ncbi:MAG: hypothetical protein ACLFPS_07950 [Clostridia bacterium]
MVIREVSDVELDNVISLVWKGFLDFEANIEVVGAFSLANYAKDEVRNQFRFPIKSLLRYNSLLENCY